jgi:hypothetical protein
MQLALFVDPTAGEYDLVIEAATFVAEIASERGTPVVLSCSPSAALAIGLALLGKAESRTVEGSERAPSPLILASLKRGADDSQLLDFEDGVQVDGTLTELVDLGVIASKEEAHTDPFGADDPVNAFLAVLRRREVSVVIGLGSEPQFWKPTINYLQTVANARLLRSERLSPPQVSADGLRIIVAQPRDLSIHRPERDEKDRGMSEDGFEEYIFNARREAAVVASLVEALLAELQGGGARRAAGG